MQSEVGELVSWSSMKEKFWRLEKKCFELRQKVKVDEKFEFSHFEKFSLEKFGWNGKTWKIEAKSSFLSKNSSKLSLLGFSRTLQS